MVDERNVKLGYTSDRGWDRLKYYVRVYDVKELLKWGRRFMIE